MQSEQPLYRAALNVWCSRKKYSIDYHYQPSEGGFICTVMIKSMSYSPSAYAANKKNAANLGAFEFLKFLVHNKYINDEELSQPCYTPLNVRNQILEAVKTQLGESSTPIEDKIMPVHQPIEYENEYQDNQYSGEEIFSIKRKIMDYSGFNLVPEKYLPRSQQFFYPQAPPILYAVWIKQSKSSQKRMKTHNDPPPVQSEPKQFQQPNTDRAIALGTEEFLDMMLNKTKKKAKNSFDKVEDFPEIGGYTLANAKHLLGNFLTANQVENTNYVFDEDGPPHNKIFTACLSFTALGREISETGTGRTKQEAAKFCAFKVMRQLFQEELIEAFTTSISKRSLSKMNYVYAIEITDYLKNIMILNYKIVQSYKSQNNDVLCYPPGIMNIPNPLEAAYDAAAQPSYLYWCPPMEKFNPWSGRTPSGTIYEDKSMDEINSLLHEGFLQTVKNPKFKELIEQRSQMPIFQIKERVVKLVESNSILLIKGSTGCGKTTQVPQFILDSYLKNSNGANCSIVVTQPRRISSISIAERVAYERIEKIGHPNSSVGYSVRFDHQYPRPYGSIMFCTTGHLIRRLHTGLRGVSHIIIDEVHERDINTDCLLVLVRDLVKMGHGLKVVIMSATIGVQRFQKYFDNCHVLEIEGNLFPVEKYHVEDIIEIMKWNPKRLSYVEEREVSDLAACRIDNADESTEQLFNMMSMNEDQRSSYSKTTLNLMNVLKEGVICYELIEAILEYIYKIDENGDGAVLIFLPGWQAIFSLFHFLKRHRLFGDEHKFLLLPLHSRLSSKENSRVFHKSHLRKIILSTNIAETSITIDDVVFVIDSCLLKRKVYDSRTNVTNYVVDWVAKSNIQQRKGRAGRLRSGYFFALCSKQRYNTLEEFKIPEIMSSSLVETCLLVKYLGFGDVEQFMEKLPDPPPKKAVEQALTVLQDINAFDSKNLLTPLGQILVKIPMDPRLGKMVLQGTLLDVGSPVVTIAAASSLSNELFDFSELAQVGAQLMKLDDRNFSDHWLSFCVYNMYENLGGIEEITTLNKNALFQLQNARKQLIDILRGVGFPNNLYISKPTYSKTEIDTILGLLITAFYPNICAYSEGRRIITSEKKLGLIHKSSVMYSYVWDRVLDRIQDMSSPLFVYTEKAKLESLISAKQLTMVTFIQYLLFGVRKYEFPVSENSSHTILLDGWLEVKMDSDAFECVWVVRREFEAMLMRICHEPHQIAQQNHFELTIVNTIKSMCSSKNVRFHLENKKEVGTNGAPSYPAQTPIPIPPPPPPPKF